MRLRERLPVLWQGPTQVRIGIDPRWSVVLADLSPGAARGLISAPAGATERTLRTALRREGTSPTEADDVIAHLRAAHLMVSEAPRDNADAGVLALLESDGAVGPALARRTAARVRVCGLGRLGAGVVRTLAAAGIGRIELEDSGVVGRHDVGWAGLTSADVGRSRSEAVARTTREAAESVVGPPDGSAVDLVVLVEHAVADPTRHRPLMTDGTSHLSVVVREASVLVGPLVVPGASACLRCADLHRTDVDPHWPAIAAQLAVRRPLPEETVLAAVGGSLAAAQVLAWVDGRAGAPVDGRAGGQIDDRASSLAGAALEVRLPEAVPRLITWRPHPECGCTHLP